MQILRQYASLNQTTGGISSEAAVHDAAGLGGEICGFGLRWERV